MFKKTWLVKELSGKLSGMTYSPFVCGGTPVAMLKYRSRILLYKTAVIF